MDDDAWTDMARRRVVVRRHVGRDDGGDDAPVVGAHAVALSPDGWHGRNAPALADRTGGRRALLRVDDVRSGRLSIGRRAGGNRDATAHAGARCSDRGRRRRRHRRHSPVHRMEGPSPCLRPGAIGTRTYVAGGCCHGLATRAAPRSQLHLRLRWLYGDPPRHRGHGSACDGSSHGSNYCRTARTERRARRARHRDCRGRGRPALDCEGGSRARITRRIVRSFGMVTAVRVGTDMFLIALGAQELASSDAADSQTKATRQTRRVISQRRFRRRKSGMDTTQESKMASSIFIGRWTPKILFSLRYRPYRNGQLPRQLGSLSQRMLTRTLRNRESAALIARRLTQSKAITVEHSLTKLGS